MEIRMTTSTTSPPVFTDIELAKLPSGTEIIAHANDRKVVAFTAPGIGALLTITGAGVPRTIGVRCEDKNVNFLARALLTGSFT